MLSKTNKDNWYVFKYQWNFANWNIGTYSEVFEIATIEKCQIDMQNLDGMCFAKGKKRKYEK